MIKEKNIIARFVLNSSKFKGNILVMGAIFGFVVLVENI